MSLESLPQLGRNPVTLTVKMPRLPERGTQLTDAIRELYVRSELCDVMLSCCGQTFMAHRCVLAAQSPVLKQDLSAPSAPTLPQSPTKATDLSCAVARQECRITDISNFEAVKFMLDFLYEVTGSAWDSYNPRTQDVNKDVLRLAQQFQLPGLTERAARWLAKDLNTGNVIERLAICEEFSLRDLYAKILDQVSNNRKALFEISSCPELVKHPALMQALLQQQASALGDDPQPKKKLKKA